MASSDLYATIYVYALLPRNELGAFLKSRSAEIPQRYLRKISVMTNKDPSGEVYSRPDDGDFVYYPYRLEVDLDATVCDRAQAIRAVTALVRALKAAGFSAVPSCKYEEELPGDVRWFGPQ